MAIRVHYSSGNVFEDVGFPPDVAANLLLRSELTVAILRIIQEQKLTQKRAATLFGVTQPRVSDLVRGRLELFSIDGLVNMLATAGMVIEVSVRARPLAPTRTGRGGARSARR